MGIFAAPSTGREEVMWDAIPGLRSACPGLFSYLPSGKTAVATYFSAREVRALTSTGVHAIALGHEEAAVPGMIVGTIIVCPAD